MLHAIVTAFTGARENALAQTASPNAPSTPLQCGQVECGPITVLVLHLQATCGRRRGSGWWTSITGSTWTP